MRKFGWIFLAVLSGLLSIAGVEAAFTSSDKAAPNLVISAVCLLIAILSIRKVCKQRRNPTAVHKMNPPHPLASPKSSSTRTVKPADTFSISAGFTAPDEEIETPDWAELSYLDAQALKFWNGKTTGFLIPDYYSGSAFGRNAGPALRCLLAGGYLRCGGIQRSIERKTIPELKAILSKKGLKISGRKGELVQRLLNSVPSDELEDLFPEEVYEITEKGRRALSQYEVVFENQNYNLGFSYYRILDAKNRYPKEEPDVLLTRLISEDIAECYRTQNRARYQELLPKAARFMEEKGDTLKALELMILSYFVWTMETKQFPATVMDTQNQYLARNVEEYAKKDNLTFNQMVKCFTATIRKSKPFGLSSEGNINYSLNMLKKGLSIKR